jgi:hypothetical protein
LKFDRRERNFTKAFEGGRSHLFAARHYFSFVAGPPLK